MQAQRNGASRRAATTSATHHAPGEGYSTASVADGRQAICNSSAACSTTYFRARRREHARGAPVTRTNLCPSRNSTATDARAHGAPGGAIQRSGGVESRHAARSQPLRAERPLRVIGGMRSSRLRSATREPAQALDQCHPAAGVAPGPLHPSSTTGRDIGAVSCHGAGPLSDSPRSSMPSSRCSSSHSDHMLRLSGSASVAMNELCAGLLRIARDASAAGLRTLNAAEFKQRPPRSRDGACT